VSSAADAGRYRSLVSPNRAVSVQSATRLSTWERARAVTAAENIESAMVYGRPRRSAR
jgi:hypothetical protein